MDRQVSDPWLPEIVLVTSHGCHMCEMAKDTIAAVSVDLPLHLRTVEMAEPEGAKLASSYQMPFPPLTLIDGQFHGYGRLSEKKFRRALIRLAESRTPAGDLKNRG